MIKVKKHDMPQLTVLWLTVWHHIRV